MLKLTLCLLALAVAVMGMLGGGKAPVPKNRVTCGCHYPRIYMPVCGSDNLTYDNSGVVRCVNICNETNITVQYKGVCKKA